MPGSRSRCAHTALRRARPRGLRQGGELTAGQMGQHRRAREQCRTGPRTRQGAGGRHGRLGDHDRHQHQGTALDDTACGAGNGGEAERPRNKYRQRGGRCGLRRRQRILRHQVGSENHHRRTAHRPGRNTSAGDKHQTGPRGDKFQRDTVPWRRLTRKTSIRGHHTTQRRRHSRRGILRRLRPTPRADSRSARAGHAPGQRLRHTPQEITAPTPPPL